MGKTHNQKAQAAIEMLSYATFFLFIFVTAVAIFIFIESQENSRAENAYAQQIAYGFAESIQTTFIAGDGFEQTVRLPSDLLGKPYLLMVSKGESPQISQTGLVYVSWDAADRGGSFSAPTVTTNYTVTTSPYVTYESPVIIISPGVKKINLTNNKGAINIEAA